MGWTHTKKFVNIGVRRKPHRRIGGGQPHQKWDYIRTTLDQLVRNGRLHTTLERCKEFQQFAEELILLAKKDDLTSQRQVESIIRSPVARSLLYERLVPLYADRPYHFTRVVNHWYLRTRDSGHMAYLEFVDRPGEIRPAKPVGYAKRLHLYEVMTNGVPREKRRLWNQAVLEGVITSDGKLIASKDNLLKQSEYLWELDDDIKSVNISGPSTSLNDLLKLTDGKDDQNQSHPVTNALVPLEHALSILDQTNQEDRTIKRAKPKFNRKVLSYSGRRMVVRGNRAFEQFRTPIDQLRREKAPRFRIRVKFPKV